MQCQCRLSVQQTSGGPVSVAQGGRNVLPSLREVRWVEFNEIYQMGGSR